MCTRLCFCVCLCVVGENRGEKRDASGRVEILKTTGERRNEGFCAGSFARTSTSGAEYEIGPCTLPYTLFPSPLPLTSKHLIEYRFPIQAVRPTLPLLKFHILTVPSLAPVSKRLSDASKPMELIFEVPCAFPNLVFHLNDLFVFKATGRCSSRPVKTFTSKCTTPREDLLRPSLVTSEIWGRGLLFGKLFGACM